MKILFIGGTGRLSKDVAKYALLQGDEVYLLTRGSANRERYVETGYNMLYANVRDIAESKASIGDLCFDVVIDFLSFRVEDLATTLEVVKGKFQQYIFISSATVYDAAEGEIISENKTRVGNDKWSYAYEKYRCEKYLEEYFSEENDLQYTIVRPYVTYGNTRVPYPLVPRDTLKEWSLVERIIHDKAIPVLDIEPIETTILHTRDFAIGLVGLCLNPKAYREAFHITNNVTITWERVLDIIGDIVEHKVKKVIVSKERIYEYMPEYYGVLEGDKGREMKFDNSKLASVVPEYNPHIDVETGLKEMVQFYRDNPDIQLLDKTWDWCIDKICCRSYQRDKSGIIIYGAGDYAKRLYRFLDDLGVGVDSFCQTEVSEKECLYDIPIISKEALMKLRNIKMIFIAIANADISRDIVSELELKLSSDIKIFEMGEFININKNRIG